MKTVLTITLFVALCIPYLYNGYKFFQCDFESDYRCEAIHGLGVVIPPASWITVWFGADE